MKFYGNIFLILFSVKCQWLYQNSNAKSAKIAKIEVANTRSPVCFETVFVFPEHCAFYKSDILTSCHPTAIMCTEFPQVCSK